MKKIAFKIVAFLLMSGSLLIGCVGRFEEAKNLAPSGGIENRNAVAVAQPNEDMYKTVDISLTIMNSSVSQFEPIFLKFELHNNLERSVILDLGEDRIGAFLFTIVQADGKEIRLLSYSSEGISSLGEISIRPGTSYTQEVLLNRWFIPTNTGQFFLKTRLANPVKDEKHTIMPGPSIPDVQFEIQPRSESRLKKICSALAQKVLESSNYEEIEKNAVTLSYIEDPVSVPFLRSLLFSNKMIEPIVIGGLERIGNDDSLKVLNDLIRERPNSEASLLAKSALEKIKNRHHP